MARRWSDADIGAAVRILAKHNHLEPALAELELTLGPVTKHAVDHALKSRDLGVATDHLGLPRSELERVLFVPDCHHPYADYRAWRLMLRAAKSFRPHSVFVLGDFGDFYTVSDHDRSPERGYSLQEELVAQRAALDELDVLGASRKHFCEGNHEYRLSRHLAKRAPEVWSMVQVEEQLGLAERGWTFSRYGDYVRHGKLFVSHDAGYAGVNAIRQSRARFEGNSVIGHVHRMGLVYEGNAHGETHVGACFGWLGDRKALAMRYANDIQKARDWQLGFGVGWMEPTGTVHLQAIPIVDYKCVLNGRLFTLDEPATCTREAA